MNPIDILGELLGQKSSRGGRGSDVLNDIFRRSSQSSKASHSSERKSIDQQAKELEDLLNVANGRRSDTSQTDTTFSTPTKATRESPRDDSRSEQDRAVLLIRAMVNAAKADGRLDAKERETIIKQLHEPSREAIEFLRQEFERPVNVREFAMSVPVGMEQQVYTMSLIAIDLDTGDEAKYLMQLAESLRLPTEVREQIHQRLGAPSIY